MRELSNALPPPSCKFLIMEEKEMTQEVIIETIILSPFPQMINGEEYTAFIVLAKTKNEDGSVNPR